MRVTAWMIAVLLTGAPGAWAGDRPIFLSGPRARASVSPHPDPRWRHVVRQSLDVSCGTAALATILNYEYGDGVSEQELIGAIFKHVKEEEVRRRGGFSLLDLKRASVGRHYHVEGYRLSVEQLGQLGHPAIVLVTIRQLKHFVVFRGLSDDQVVLADPAVGNTTMSREEFLKAWNGMALVITRDGPAPFPSMPPIVSDKILIHETPSPRRFVETALP